MNKKPITSRKNGQTVKGFSRKSSRPITLSLVSSPQAPEKSRRLSSCYVNYENLLKAEGYMTAVMGRVSIVALASVLITYCLFPKLRNLPGVNIVNLTTALFIAEIIFITGEDIQVSPYPPLGNNIPTHPRQYDSDELVFVRVHSFSVYDNNVPS